MKHYNVYDSQGRQCCCSEREIASSKMKSCHSHFGINKSVILMFLPSVISFILLVVGMALDYFINPDWANEWFRIIWYICAYIPVGVPVIKEAVESIAKGEIFSEFMLMSLASIGAFFIGEYHEGVAVMLFYSIGEICQTLAVKRAESNIKILLDQRPCEATIIENEEAITIKAENVEIGDIVKLKPCEKLALDGILISESAVFNTSALTGESHPCTKYKGDIVLAGMLNLNTIAFVKITDRYQDSKLSRILELVQNASSRKPSSELFIRKFAKIYTPIVVAVAAAICIVPLFLIPDYQFTDWLYRALIFLVISCPCALVISIPLGYFGGIGAASRNGILIKGGNFLDILASAQTVVMDKTGTLTEGVFEVQEVIINPDVDKTYILKIINAIESNTCHPIASAICNFVGKVDSNIHLADFEEIAGYGLRATVEHKEVLAGNFKLMDKFGITYNIDENDTFFSIIAIAYDKKFVGYIKISDRIKQDAKVTIDSLTQLGVNSVMLSGDKSAIVNSVAAKLCIPVAFGDLLPENKVDKMKEIKDKYKTVAFVGDGVNDTPVIALSDVGIAMGGLGCDAAIETADVVIQDDMPHKIPIAIKIGRQTKQIILQNVTLALTIKILVLALGVADIASIWEAVVADAGVALLAILNTIRLQKMKFKI